MIITREEKRRILQQKIEDELRKFHTNACYPTPLDEEVRGSMATIMYLIDDAIF
jgi:hypothetical protein